MLLDLLSEFNQLSSKFVCILYSPHDDRFVHLDLLLRDKKEIASFILCFTTEKQANNYLASNTNLLDYYTIVMSLEDLEDFAEYYRSDLKGICFQIGETGVVGNIYYFSELNLKRILDDREQRSS